MKNSIHRLMLAISMSLNAMLLPKTCRQAVQKSSRRVGIWHHHQNQTIPALQSRIVLRLFLPCAA
ncbi:hypothetical protein [Providencia stuartii]|uniref:hypothetical protein n=1 Tax=Providencia stuartii TaxID=588 RepID=UPI001604B4C6|nr:hypothetical protein [Providencia stuartii]HEM8865392.1 hypothetical protein [Providencia stuartii]